MSMKLYVGNLSLSTTSRIWSRFSEKSARSNRPTSSKTIIPDARADSRSSKCRATKKVKNAIVQFNGKEIGGRSLTVNEAKPREDRGGDGSRW
jgi:hypothetical protein